VPSSKVFADINAGGLIFNDNFYAALGAAHLARPDDGWVQSNVIPIQTNLQAGYIFKPKKLEKNDNENWYFSPNIYFLSQQKMHEINITALAGLGYAQAGIGYRNSTNADAMIFHIAFLNNQFRIGYSFDFNISTKYYLPRNAHEISIQYLFKRKRKGVDENNWSQNETNHRNRRIKCPNFFR
jgi:type IX secretion system PorP/SprF family membrane protein